jgi:hypothetical protein
MIRFIIPLVLLLFSFSRENKSLTASKTIAPDSVKTATDSILHLWLGKQVVENTVPRFRSLWFFVSEKELDSIRESHQLLRSFKFETKEQQRYYSWLTNSKFDQQPVASILRASEKLRIRDAWTSYWPLMSSDPSNGMSNGNQLVQVILEDSSLFVQFQPQEKNPFIVYDVYGNIVSLPQAIKREKHIAAVFMNYSMKEKSVNSKLIVVHHRSFYLVNEKMIRHWQHATPSMQDGIINDLNYLLLLNAWIKDSDTHIGKAGKKGKNILQAWNALPAKRSIPEKIFACRRSSEPFDANGTEIDKAIATIRSIWPLQVKTMEKFPSKGIR